MYNTTGNVFQGEGRTKQKLNYKTATPSPAFMDKIIRALRHIAKLSAEYDIPTLFVGAYPYDSLAILGYMPLFSQTLNNEKVTTASLTIEEVGIQRGKLNVGTRTGTSESTPEEIPEDPCSSVLFDYPMIEYNGSDTDYDYPLKEYNTCP